MPLKDIPWIPPKNNLHQDDEFVGRIDLPLAGTQRISLQLQQPRQQTDTTNLECANLDIFPLQSRHRPAALQEMDDSCLCAALIQRKTVLCIPPELCDSMPTGRCIGGKCLGCSAQTRTMRCSCSVPDRVLLVQGLSQPSTSSTVHLSVPLHTIQGDGWDVRRLLEFNFPGALTLADLERSQQGMGLTAPSTRYNLRPRIQSTRAPATETREKTSTLGPTLLADFMTEGPAQVHPDACEMPAQPQASSIWKCLHTIFRQAHGKEAGSFSNSGQRGCQPHMAADEDLFRSMYTTASLPDICSSLCTEWTLAPRFSVSAPACIAEFVQSHLLECAVRAVQHSGGYPKGWHEVTQPARSDPSSEPITAPPLSVYEWDVIPSSDWQEQARQCRASVGCHLVDRAMSYLNGHSDGRPLLCEHSIFRRNPNSMTPDI